MVKLKIKINLFTFCFVKYLNRFVSIEYYFSTKVYLWYTCPSLECIWLWPNLANHLYYNLNAQGYLKFSVFTMIRLHKINNKIKSVFKSFRINLLLSFLYQWLNYYYFNYYGHEYNTYWKLMKRINFKVLLIQILGFQWICKTNIAFIHDCPWMIWLSQITPKLFDSIHNFYLQ